MIQYTSSVDGLIEALNKIKEIHGGHIPVQVNAIGTDHVTALSLVCIDDDLVEEPIVYIETILDDKSYSPTFTMYSLNNREGV